MQPRLHKECLGMSTTESSRLGKSDDTWNGPSCQKPNKILRRYILSQKTTLISVLNRSTYQPNLLWLIVLPMFLCKVRKMTKVMKRSNQAPHPTQDTTRESNKNTINITNKSQEVSPFPAGDHKAVNTRRESIRNTRHK